MKTITASYAYYEVVSEVEKIANANHATIATMSAGDVLRQGDLYILALDKAILDGKPAGTCQLAPGTTQGSRHIVEGDCDVLIVDPDRAKKVINRLVPSTKGQQLFIGPMIVARSEVTIVHPEHGDRSIPAGVYLTTYQRTWAQEIRRTQD